MRNMDLDPDLKRLEGKIMAQILTPRSRRTRNSTWSRTVSACMDPRASSGMHTHGGHVYRSIVHGGAGGASCKTLCGPRQPTPCYRVMDRRYYFVLKRTIWARTCSTAVPLGRRGRAHHAVSNHPPPPIFFTNTPSGRCQVTATCKQPLMLL